MVDRPGVGGPDLRAASSAMNFADRPNRTAPPIGWRPLAVWILELLCFLDLGFWCFRRRLTHSESHAFYSPLMRPRQKNSVNRDGSITGTRRPLFSALAREVSFSM